MASFMIAYCDMFGKTVCVLLNYFDEYRFWILKTIFRPVSFNLFPMYFKFTTTGGLRLPNMHLNLQLKWYIFHSFRIRRGECKR